MKTSNCIELSGEVELFRANFHQPWEERKMFTAENVSSVTQGELESSFPAVAPGRLSYFSGSS
jgi:hypothetical protein